MTTSGAGPFHAFVYLTSCSIKNRVRVRLRRLRQPRYLIGTIVGVLYFYYFVFRPRPRRRSGGSGAPAPFTPFLDRYGAHLELLGAGALLLITALSWIWPGSRQPLTFTRPEVQFLFTAPLSRRQLLHYKLLRTQLGAIFSSAIMAVFVRPGSLATTGMFLVGVWMIQTTLSLHLMGVSLLRSSLARHGGSGLARQWVSLAALVIVGGLGVAAITPVWPQLAAAADFRTVTRELQQAATSVPGAILLWPFRMLVRVSLARSGRDFVFAFVPAIAILALNYRWVLRADAAFEEASADAAERAATQRKEVFRPTIRKTAATPFALALTGRPETAVIWKNLIMIGRYASLKMLFRIVPALIVFSIMLTQSSRREGLAAALGTVCLFLTAITVAIGPQLARNDLRHDLSNLAVLKSWPMRGASLLRGEVLASASLLSIFAWLWILLSAVLVGSIRARGETELMLLAHRAAIIAAAFMLAPALILTQVVIQNGIAVMFPAWIVVTGVRARGIDAMGQRMIILFGSLVTVIFALVPAAIAAALVGGAIFFVTGTIPIVVPAFVGAVTLLAECWAATELLGRVLDRTDVTAVEAVET